MVNLSAASPVTGRRRAVAAFAALAVCGASFVGLAGCSRSTGSESTTTTPTIPPAAVAQLPAAPDVTGKVNLVSATQQGTINPGEAGRSTAMNWRSSMVAVPGHDALNKALATQGADSVKAHIDDDKATTAYALDWAVAAASGKAFGIRLASHVTNPQAEGETTTSTTTYTLADTDDVITSPQLFSDAGKTKAVSAIVKALQEKKLLPSGEAPQVNADALLTDVVVRPDQSAVVVVSPSVLPLTPKQTAGVSIPTARLKPMLSAAGKRVTHAASWTAPTPSTGKAAGKSKKSASPSASTAQPAVFVGISGNAAGMQVIPPQPVNPDAVDCTKVKCVALTYDDGPGDYTTQILDVLKQNQVHATFFLVGKHVAAHPELVKREVDEGNAVGIHTWDHPDLTKLAPPAITDEVKRTADAIEKASGVRPNYIRPPFGAVDQHVMQTFGQIGQAAVFWNIDTEDWKNKNTDLVYQRAVAHPKPGMIILMHDVHPYGPEASPKIIATLKQQGYTFVTIPQMFAHNLQAGHKYFSQHEVH